MRELIPGQIWVSDSPLRVYGIEFGHRTTVIRLNDGSLFVHAPGRLDAAFRNALEKLGEPRFFVCPGAWHDAFIDRPFHEYPDARVYAPPGKSGDWRGLPFHAPLAERPESEWAADLDQTVFDGGPRFQEVVFLHRASGTLILADLIADIGAEVSFLTRIYARLTGVYERPGFSRGLRLAVRDHDSSRQSARRILDWDFDRIIVGHGRNVDSGGKEVFRAAFEWLRI